VNACTLVTLTIPLLYFLLVEASNDCKISGSGPWMMFESKEKGCGTGWRRLARCRVCCGFVLSMLMTELGANQGLRPHLNLFVHKSDDLLQ
jgi:hypothetical protein